MSYEPTVWKTGDIVSSEKLNKLEEGVAGAGSGSSSNTMVVDISWDSSNGTQTLVADKTVSEIIAALKNASINVVANFGTERTSVIRYVEDPDDGDSVIFTFAYAVADKLLVQYITYYDGRIEHHSYSITMTAIS